MAHPADPLRCRALWSFIMYSILFSILLASTYVSAIPMPLGALYEHQPDNDAERTNKAAFTTSLGEANRQIGNMQEVLKNPNDPRIKTAFGPNANHAEISKVVDTLATKKLKVQSMDPNMADQEAGRAVNGFVPIGKGGPQSARFGSTFFSTNTKQQAGSIIHEATHQLAGTGDHVDPTAKRIIPAGETSPKNVQANGGYAASLDPPTASTLGSKYENMRDTVANTHQNADSYRVFAALCSRSLYKRALLKDDPVGYYLSKRSQCKLPPDYFAKKAAAAKAKGTAATATKGKTSPAAANGKASTAKSTGVNGAKDLKGAATTAKGVNTVRKGTSTRKATGSVAGKGLKTVKGTKTAMGLKTAKAGKGPGAVKGAKTIKAPKAGKGVKVAKGVNAAKEAKAVDGVRAAKGAKGVKTVKATKAGKGVKVAKGVKAVKGAKAINGVKAAKGAKTIKTPRATKGVKVVKGVKPAKEAKAAKGARTVKTTKAGNEAKVAKGAKAAKGVKAINGVKAAKGARTVETPRAGKGVKIAKGVKPAKEAKATKGTASPKSVKATKSPKSTATTKISTKAGSSRAVKLAAPKAAAKVTAAIPKKGKSPRRT